MTVAAHPSSETLAAFARGDLPSTELAAVAEHIGTCSACCEVLSRVPENTLAKLAQAAGELTSSLSTAIPIPAARAGASDTTPPALADHPRYKILRELGAGGMGVVYKAEHRIMGRVVALKVMAPHLTAKAGAVERFRKEVRAAAQLSHENIVTAHDADEAGGMHFLVMEYVEGVSLDRLVAKKGPLALHLAASFTRQAAIGLQHAHEKGMVHRDIKPQNLMVTRKAKVKVMDFGLARFVGADEEEAPTGRLPFGAAKPVADPMTNPNLLMGTPDYLSPEQAKNSHMVDSRSDLYSLGCTLFFLLTGKSPFAHAPSLIDKLLAHTEEEPPSIRELRPDVPEGLAAVLNKMLEKHPDDRYETAIDVANALYPFTRSGGGDEAKPAGFEVIDAVIIAPPAPMALAATAIPGGTPAGTPIPLPAASPAFEFDTEPVPDGPTVAEAPRPRRSKKLKKAARRPWWKRTPVILGMVAAVLAVVAIALAAGKKKDADPLPKGDDTAGSQPEQRDTPQPPKPNPFRPGGSGGTQVTGTKPVLYVVPSEQLYGPDYYPVVAQLETAGVKVVTASGRGTAAFFQDFQKTIKTERLADVKAEDYSLVVFCGFKVNEYIPGGTESETTRRLLAEMQKQEKPIAAICVGQRVLVEHGLLDGKRAARSEHLLKNFGDYKQRGIKWEEDDVVTAVGKILTTGSDRNAEKFGERLAEAATKKSPGRSP